jgi:hypothetical protein
MSFKVNSINPFDRKFFGRSMRKFIVSKNVTTPLKVNMDSVDDFNRHFQKQLFELKKSSVQPQSTDTFKVEDFTNIPSIF